MSQLPPLVPSSRLYTPGDMPQSRFESMAGIDASFRRGGEFVGQRLVLSYNNLNETQFNLFAAHYTAQNGTFGRFFLSPETWSGLVATPVPLIGEYLWRYNSPLVASHASCGRFNVEVELRAEPIDLGDVVFDGSVADPLNPVRIYIVDGLTAAATPLRIAIIEPGGAA
jgi:hypothetical protein